MINCHHGNMKTGENAAVVKVWFCWRESMQTVNSRTSFYVFLLCAQIKCSSSNCNRLQPILICSSSHLAPLIMICCTQIWLQEYQPNVKFPSPVIRCLTFLVHSPNILLKYSQATDYFAVIFVDFKLLVVTLKRAIFFHISSRKHLTKFI